MKRLEHEPASGKKALDVPPANVSQFLPPSSDHVLTREQAAKLKENIDQMRHYVIRVHNRMHECHMVESKVFDQMKTLEDDLHKLWVTLHYTACFGREG